MELNCCAHMALLGMAAVVDGMPSPHGSGLEGSLARSLWSAYWRIQIGRGWEED